MFKALQDGWIPPSDITEEQYNNIKNNRSAFPDHLVAFVGFACSYGGRYFQAYARNKQGDNYAKQGRNSLLEKIKKLSDVTFYCCQYYDLNIPPKSVIYCDPPYKNTVGYGFDFDHNEFYQWCEDQVRRGHKVYVSEYSAPFKEVWSCEVRCELHKKAKTRVEKLFSVHEPTSFSLRKY